MAEIDKRDCDSASDGATGVRTPEGADAVTPLSTPRLADTSVKPDQPQVAPASMNHPHPGRFTYRTGARPLEGYTIKRGIGVGGFGEVYFALSDAGKEVALKRIQRNLDIELRGVKQCLNLKHLNLIALWDIRSSDAGESWVVMEYVPGKSLQDLIDAHPKGMPEELIRLWFCSTAAGVAYLHEQGIVHRDLKPGNIFYDEDQRVIKIGDYGLSKFISHSRRSGQTETVGTFHYMAPEIGRGNYGKQIDIYALGIVLYEMLTGNVPFDGESSQEIIMKHLTADPDLDRIPLPFRPAIAKALEKDPDRRFESIGEFVRALPWNEPLAADPIAGPIEVNAIAESGEPGGNSQESLSLDQTGDSPIQGMLISDVDVELIERGIAFGPLQESVGAAPAEPIVFLDPPGSAGGPAERGDQAAEPIALAAGSVLDRGLRWWSESDLSTPLKIGLVIGVGLLVAANSAWLFPLALILGLVYLVYFWVRQWSFHSGTDPHSAGSKTVRTNRRERLRQRNRKLREYLAGQPVTVRGAELTGGLLVGAISSALFNLFGLALDGSILDATVTLWAMYGWSVMVCLVAIWSLLILEKFWESRDGDVWLRRLATGCLGVGIGLVSWFGGQYLNLPFDRMVLSEASVEGPLKEIALQLPIALAYPMFFGGLFLVIRWWRLADPIRRTRLSIWSIGQILIWSILLAWLGGLDPVRHAILVTVIAVGVQLAAPWIPRMHRDVIAKGAGLHPGRV